MSFTYKYQSVDGYGRYHWQEKPFHTKADLLHYLVTEKEAIFAQKKSIIKRAEGGLSAMFHTAFPVEVNKHINKAKPLYENNKEAGILKRTILANTYWWMDSHSDVHLGRGPEGDTAIFSETIKGREGKIYPIDQHNWSLDGRMGKTLALYEAPISWRSLGVGRTGMTEGLFAEAQIEKSKNERRYNDYLSDEVDQHSVGMRYLDIMLAVDDEEEYPNEYKIFQKYINRIGNRKAVEDQGFFFAIGKAYLGEYSAVIAGSNELTPTMGGQGAGAAESTSDAGASKGLLEAIEKHFNVKVTP